LKVAILGATKGMGRAVGRRLAEWQAIRHRWDPEGRFRSAQSVRLLGDRP